MPFLRWLLGPPDVIKLHAQGNVRGLIKALDYEKDVAVRKAAARALVGMGKAQQAVDVLKNSDRSLAIEPLLVIMHTAGAVESQSAAIALQCLGGDEPTLPPPGAAGDSFDQYALVPEEELPYQAGSSRPQTVSRLARPIRRSRTQKRRVPARGGGESPDESLTAPRSAPRRREMSQPDDLSQPGDTLQGEAALQSEVKVQIAKVPHGGRGEPDGEFLTEPGGAPQSVQMPRDEARSQNGGEPQNRPSPQGGVTSQGPVLPIVERVSRPGIAPVDGLASLGGFSHLAEARKDRGPVTRPLPRIGRQWAGTPPSTEHSQEESEGQSHPVRGLVGPIQVRRAVEELVKISARYPDDVWATPAEARVIAIGRDLDKAGGLRLMRMVYYQYMDRLPQVSQEAFKKGWCRNLHRWWTGIGDWGC